MILPYCVQAVLAFTQQGGDKVKKLSKMFQCKKLTFPKRLSVKLLHQAKLRGNALSLVMTSIKRIHSVFNRSLKLCLWYCTHCTCMYSIRGKEIH